MRHTQYKPVNGHHLKLGIFFSDVSFHRNTSPLAFRGWREVERVTSCVCAWRGAVYSIKCSYKMSQRGREGWNERKGARAGTQQLHVTLNMFKWALRGDTQCRLLICITEWKHKWGREEPCRVWMFYFRLPISQISLYCTEGNRTTLITKIWMIKFQKDIFSRILHF